MKTFWLIAIVLIFNGMMISAISTHIINFGINIGFAATAAAFLSTILASVSIGGRFFIGWASDKIDVRRILQLGYGMICLAMIWGVLSGTMGRGLVFAMVTVFALGYGGMSVIRAQLVRSYFGLKAYGKIMGFLQSISTIGVVIGPILGGGIFDATGSYHLLWLIYAVIAICPIVIAAVLQKPEFAEDKIGSK
jgi:MFS family permease